MSKKKQQPPSIVETPVDLASSPQPAETPAVSPYPWMLTDLQGLAVPLENIHLDPNNARSHDARSLRGQMESLRTFGQTKPIIGNRRNHTIVAGNGLYLAMAELRKTAPERWTHIAKGRSV